MGINTDCQLNFMINLNDVTLVGIDGIGGDKKTAKAMKYSQQGIDFGQSILFSASNDRYDFCDTVQIERLTYDECQEFTLTKLIDYIKTDYMLIVQGDGFVVNADSWNLAFLDFDYIGAPWFTPHTFQNTKRWPIIHEQFARSAGSYNVGNGGFSLRSKKLMTGVKNIYSEEYNSIPEDGVICIGMRHKLEELGCKFAPPDVAALFSCESRFVEFVYESECGSCSDLSFGFHCGETHSDKVELLEKVEL